MEQHYWEGYEAALVQDFTNPHAFWTLACWQWQLGNMHGHQVLCAALEHILKTQD